MTTPVRRSLRLRLAALFFAAILAALAVAGLGLVWLFERHVERRLGAELDVYLDQLAASVAFEADGALVGAPQLADPRFRKVFSGLYWQIEDEKSGGLLRSRSLWDAGLDMPADEPEIGVLDRHDIAGPLSAELLAHERRLLFEAPDGRRVLRLAVAIDRRDVDALTSDFAQDVALSLGLLALLLTAAAAVQLQLGLRPLEAVRDRIAAIRSGREARLPEDAPAEIGALVDELNALLASQEASIDAARARAADLAHGFNTPLTSLMHDVRRLREKGETALADEIEATARAMRRQIDREMARARSRDPRRRPAPLDPAPIVEGLERTLKRTPAGERLAIETALPSGLRLAVDADDLAEILGNLLENAVRHARATARLSAEAIDEGRALLIVEDDGPGVPAHQREAIMGRGVRLDESGAGAGLGLAIVKDLAAHYDAALELGVSDLGGLRASIALPRR